MENWRKYLIDGVIIAALLTILLITVVPWPIREPAVMKDRASEFVPPLQKQAQAPLKKNGPLAVAGVFGYRPAPAPAVPRDPGPRQSETLWISYLGYIINQNGKTKYFFKDKRTNRLLTLHLGEQNGDGWKLASISDKFYIVENKGEIYKVPR
jgi:hypothetical protein